MATVDRLSKVVFKRADDRGDTLVGRGTDFMRGTIRWKY